MAITAILDLHLRDDAVAGAAARIDEILATTRGFDGNLGVEVLDDLDDPTHVTVVEHWESVEHDDAYRAFRATPAGANDLAALLAGPPVQWRVTSRSIG